MRPFFGTSTPEEMLETARRQLVAYETNPSVDSARNFFVAVQAVREYAKSTGLTAATAAMNADPHFELCNIAANHGKHLSLTHQHTVEAIGRRNYDTHADGPHYQGVEEFAVIADGRRVDVSTLGRAVILTLERILAAPRTGPVVP